MTDTSTGPIRADVVVDVPIEQAFAVFTGDFASWWPTSHHIGAAVPETVVLEPCEGGRWYERAADGTECDWGAVLAWEPPSRLVLAWRLTATWDYDPDPARQTEVEVRFTPLGDARTKVELEHRLLERYGENENAMRATFESDSGWAGILRGFAAAAADRSVMN